MPQFDVHTLETAPEGSRPVLARLKSEIGFIPNLAAAMAESPALLESFATLRAVNGRSSSLPAADRELASIAVAREYGCTYCVAAHSLFASMAGVSENVIGDVRDGRKPDDARAATITAMAARIVRANGRLGPDEVRSFTEGGFAPRQLLDLFATIAQVTLASQAFLLAGTPLDAAFQPRQWEKR
jgi:uncharacterized peroxidase-related enzyme